MGKKNLEQDFIASIMIKKIRKFEVLKVLGEIFEMNNYARVTGTESARFPEVIRKLRKRDGSISA